MRLVQRMKNVAQKSKKTKPATKNNRGRKASLQMESLEIRDLLVGNALDFVDNLAVTSGQPPAIMTLDFDPSSDSAIFGLRIAGQSGNLDPSTPFMYLKDSNRSLAANHITPLQTIENVGGTTDSLIIFEAGPADLTIEVGGTGSGDFHASLFIVGDSDGDGVVTETEKMTMVAAELQGRGAGNFNTAEYFKLVYNIDFNQDQYDVNGDANGNSKIDAFELGYITSNSENSTIIVDLIGDNSPPEINASIFSDTGLSGTDSISKPPATNTEVAISGTIQDFSKITSAVLSIDGTTGTTFDLLNNPGILSLTVTDSEIQFSLSIDDLSSLLGSSVVDSGSHTLNFIGLDEIGNQTTAPGQVFTFTFDNTAPATPSAPDLDAGSDAGSSDTDNLTNNAQPLITSSGHEVGSFIEFFSFGSSIGSDIADASGNASVTPSILLAEGPHNISVQETDIAGNTSSESSLLFINIDTITGPPAVTLDNASSNGQLTEDALAQFSGTAEKDATVEIMVGGVSKGTATADSVTGAFTLANIALAEGSNDIQFIATDVAGNSKTLDFDVTSNKKPVINGTTISSLTLDEINSDTQGASLNLPPIATVDLTAGSKNTETLDYQIMSVTAFDGGGFAEINKVTLINVVFAINDATGELSLVSDPDGELNFEGPVRVLRFELKVSDNLGDGTGTPGTGLTSDTETFDVAINDINDRPTVDQSGLTAGTFAIDEQVDGGTNIEIDDLIGSAMENFFADVDASDTLAYSITGGNTDSAFKIDSSNGQISVNDPTKINFENIDTYTLTIQAKDDSGKSNDTITGTVSITVNDQNETPIVTNDPFALSISEHIGSSTEVPGQSVIFSNFSDPDNEKVANNQPLLFTTDDPRFVFDGTTLKTKAGVTAADFDFETVETGDHVITFNVTADDQNGKTTSAEVNVTIEDKNDAPIFNPNTLDFSIVENQVANDSVGFVGFSDADTADTHTLSVDNDPRFVFVNNVLTLAPGLTASDIDFETPGNFDDAVNHKINVAITVNDGNGGTGTAIAVVQVTGVNEAPSFDLPLSYTVSEVIIDQIGDTFGPIEFSDPEFDDPTQLSEVITITEGSIVRSGTNLFNVQADGTLETQVANIAPGIYELDVVITDLDGLTETKTISIEVLDNLPPVLDRITFSLNENLTGDSANPLITLAATDPDSPDDVPFTFEIVGGTAETKFVLLNSTSTGVDIALKTGAVLDFEDPTVLTLEIKTTDSVGSAQTETVTISLIDQNDQPTFSPISDQTVNEFVIQGLDPQFANPAENDVIVDLDLIVGPNMGFDDEDLNGTQALTYTITDFGGLDGAFKISGSNLVIDDPSLLDADNGQTSVTLTILADDGQGQGSNSTVSGTVTINLTQRNELPDLTAVEGTAAPDVIVSTITQNTTAAKVGFVLGNIFNELGIDPAMTTGDDPEGNQLDIIDLGSSILFSIAGNGDITLDAEITDGDLGGNSKTYDLDFLIGDGAENSTQFGYRDFQVQITISKNLPPVFALNNDSFSVNENTDDTAGTIFTAMATDPEMEGAVTFSINDPMGLFVIQTTGEISVKANAILDHETNPSYDIEVTATDILGNGTTQMVTVTVDDVNEAPTTTTDPFALSFDEDILSNVEIPGQAAISAAFSDPDNANNAPMDMDFQNLTFTTNDSRFVFDGSTLKTKLGVTSADFDFDTLGSSISFMVTASDGNLSTSATVNVTLGNVNEAPVVVGGINDMLIPESIINNGFADEDGNLTDDNFKLTFDSSNFLSAFQDPDAGDQIQLMVDPSSTINPSVIKSISFDSSNNLVVEFHHYGSEQDRSLSDIVVFAKDSEFDSAKVSFDLGVTPQKTIDIQMRNVFMPTSLNDSIDGLALANLPQNQVTIGQGATFYTEIWVTDLLGSGQVSPGRAFSERLHSIDIDFTYESTQVSAVNATITDPFLFSQGAGIHPIISTPGRVEQLVAAIGLNNAADSSGNLVTATNG
ncbi:MAG: hypothetical protein COA78_35615, partial [Blastopirellula sp.]